MDTVNIKPRRVKDFLNNEVKDFAKYVIETRSCPNIMDGLRVGARKCIWAALTGDLKNKSKVKMIALLGDVMKLHYNHGDSSLMNTIVSLSSDYVFKYKPFEVIGQIGSLRETKCDTAPRYLTIKKSEYIDLFTTDKELLEIGEDEGEKIEPRFFLPIVPVVLLYRTNSPGYGFSFRSFSYTLDSIIDNCIHTLNDGSCMDEEFQLMPDVVGIDINKNMIYNSNKNCWYNVGEFKIDEETNTLIVTDLPYDVQLSKYEEHLQTLIERGIITKYMNMSMDGNIKYIIYFSYGRLKILYNENKWKFFQTFKLYSKVTKDTLNCMDIDGKTILSFESSYELIDFFVKRRLKIYTDRKTRTIRILKEQIQELNEKILFIQLVTEGKLIINKRPIVDIKKDLDKYSLPYDVLKLRIERLTKEEIEKCNKEIKELKDYLSYIERTDEKTMYLNDLIDLKTKFCQIKKIQ